MMRIQQSNYKFIRGFTLIELLVVIAIIALLATIAVPSYLEFIKKSRRSDGISAVMSLHLAQQKFRGNCAGYAGKIGAYNCDGSDPMIYTNNAVTHPTDSGDGYYTLAPSGASNTDYIITATAQNGQEKDLECGNFILDVSGSTADKYTSTYAKDTDGAKRCWQR